MAEVPDSLCLQGRLAEAGRLVAVVEIELVYEIKHFKKGMKW